MPWGNNNNDNNKSTFELIQHLGASVYEQLDFNIEKKSTNKSVIVLVGITVIMFNWDNTKASLQDLQEVLVCKKW